MASFSNSLTLFLFVAGLSPALTCARELTSFSKTVPDELPPVGGDRLPENIPEQSGRGYGLFGRSQDDDDHFPSTTSFSDNYYNNVGRYSTESSRLPRAESYHELQGGSFPAGSESKNQYGTISDVRALDQNGNYFKNSIDAEKFASAGDVEQDIPASLGVSEEKAVRDGRYSYGSGYELSQAMDGMRSQNYRNPQKEEEDYDPLP
ncbi:hypothetical protein AXF42_Ash009898 [Apostasia shenzhenica]|uniref:Uncharacterized protein n=1 Tax=Apostasia shenzhenica TaxID=1088818 RepID=A0A2I0AC98_9ASPA|nr:hypothetical protein AXF42_Ash009898 [Apostasia shenzhenica]